MFSSAGSKSAQRRRFVANSGLLSNSSGVTVIANSGLASNNAGIFVNANTGIIANSTGTFQDFTYRPPYENIIINGNMDIWSRFFPGFATVNTTPVTVSGGVTVSGNGYVSDMWQVVPTGASVNASANTGRLLSAYSLQVNGATSVTALTIKQRIEAIDAIRTSNQQMTIQAQIWNGTTGTITPQLTVKYPTAADNYTSTSTLISANNLQSCPNSQWTQVAFSFVSNTTAQFGMEISFIFGALNTTSQIIRLTECDMQVTPGFANGLISNPPILRNRKYSEEMNLCRRHAYWGGSGCAGGWTNSSYCSIGMQYPVPMRVGATYNVLTTTPTVLEPGIADRVGSATTVLTSGGTGVNGIRFDLQGFSGATSQHPAVLEKDCMLVTCEL